MAQRDVLAETALVNLTAAAAGTYTSGPIANSGLASDVILLVHCSAVGGSAPTLSVGLESSPDGVTWTAVPGSGISALAAAGNAIANVRSPAAFIRVTATVAGTGGPTATFRAAAMYF